MTDDTLLALDSIPTTGNSALVVAPLVTLGVVLLVIVFAGAAFAWWRLRHPEEFVLTVVCWRAGISREARARVTELARQSGSTNPCAFLLCPSALEKAGLLGTLWAPLGSRVQSRDEPPRQR